MTAKRIASTTSAMVVICMVSTLASCKRTTAGTAGEGGSGSGAAATSATAPRGGASIAASVSDSAGRADSAAGNVLLNPNGAAPAGVVPAQTAAGTTSSPGIPMAPSTTVFLPTLGTTVRVPSTTPAPPASSALTSPFIPVLPQVNPTLPDSTLMPRPPVGGATTPRNGLRPNSTLVRPVTPGSTGAVTRTPR